MKFALVVTNLAGGGAEKAVIKIAAALRTRGHDVHLILLEHLIEHEGSDGAPIHALGARGTAASKGWLGKRRLARQLRNLLRDMEAGGRFDLIVSTLPFADEVTALAGVLRHSCRIANTLSAEIARLHQTDPGKARRRAQRYRRLYDARMLIAVSAGVHDDLHREFGIDTARIATIPNPFDFAAIRAHASEPASLPAQPYVIHVGRFAAQKRHDLLLDAWQRLQVPHLLVLLTKAESELDRMIQTRGLRDRVVVAGFQSNPYPWMKHARLLVLASDHEGLPNVIIEALALGTPVVSTDCPSGPREILGTAMPAQLVPTGDVAALAEAIARALDQPPDASRVDLSAYTVESVAASYEQLAQRSF